MMLAGKNLVKISKTKLRKRKQLPNTSQAPTL